MSTISIFPDPADGIPRNLSSVTVLVPVRWWSKFQNKRLLDRESPQWWLADRIQYLSTVDVTLMRCRPDAMNPYFFQALLRYYGCTKFDPFQTYWFPHAQYCPAKPMKRVTIPVDLGLKLQGEKILGLLQFTWSEFVRAKLEDWCLSKKEYERKWAYWEKRFAQSWEKLPVSKKKLPTTGGPR